jgi:hypothetical protein
VETHHLNRENQVRAWRAQIALLRTALSGLPGTWRILLECPLRRLGRGIRCSDPLREALARDAQGQGRSLRQARQETETALQPLIGFLRGSLDRPSQPHEHVIVFDEALRRGATRSRSR